MLLSALKWTQQNKAPEAAGNEPLGYRSVLLSDSERQMKPIVPYPFNPRERMIEVGI